MRETYVVLENIRSVHNVGSVFRTADAAGVTKLYLVGFTPTPLDRFGRKRTDLSKVSLGAEDAVSWEYAEGITNLIQKFKRDGVRLVVVEQDSRAIPHSHFHTDDNVAYIFGSETDGVSKEARDAADAIIEIPMQGTKESLNVSVTAGIVLFNTQKKF